MFLLCVQWNARWKNSYHMPIKAFLQMLNSCLYGESESKSLCKNETLIYIKVRDFTIIDDTKMEM